MNEAMTCTSATADQYFCSAPLEQRSSTFVLHHCNCAAVLLLCTTTTAQQHFCFAPLQLRSSTLVLHHCNCAAVLLLCTTATAQSTFLLHRYNAGTRFCLYNFLISFNWSWRNYWQSSISYLVSCIFHSQRRLFQGILKLLCLHLSVTNMHTYVSILLLLLLLLLLKKVGNARLGEGD